MWRTVESGVYLDKDCAVSRSVEDFFISMQTSRVGWRSLERRDLSDADMCANQEPVRTSRHESLARVFAVSIRDWVQLMLSLDFSESSTPLMYCVNTA